MLGNFRSQRPSLIISGGTGFTSCRAPLLAMGYLLCVASVSPSRGSGGQLVRTESSRKVVLDRLAKGGNG